MKQLKLISFIVLCFSFFSLSARPTPAERQYYEIRIYHLSSAIQENRVDKYIREALIPALHKYNVIHVGVFKALANDTAAVRRTYVIIPYRSLDQFSSVTEKIAGDKDYQTAGADYINAPYTDPPYLRIEKILTKSFRNMPEMATPKLDSSFSSRVYELRSYESQTEKLHEKKVSMFNEGNEIAIFKKLGFNAVFYSQALTGTALPNLMYMITFNDMASHDRLWKAFGNDPEWKKISGMPEYQNIMYKADSFLLRPTDYSDY